MLKKVAAALLAVAWCVVSNAGDKTLEVVQAGPAGEIHNLQEANEIRVLFSEPMVALGKIPEPVAAPFFKINPAVEGSFRWSGTRLLIFTPSHSETLPYATKYTVTVDAPASSLEGSRLAKPYQFSFTTPTVHLLSAQWYRKDGRFDSPAVIVLMFNEPVDASKAAAHASLVYKPHVWKAPAFQNEVLGRLAKNDPQSFVAFQKKVAATLLAANASSSVAFSVARNWDQKRFPASANMVVLETGEAPPPQSQILLTLDGELPAVQGAAVPGEKQTYLFQMEPAFFVTGFHCASGCSTEFYNDIGFQWAVDPSEVLKGIKVLDVTGDPNGTPVMLKGVAKSEGGEEEYYEPESGAYGSGGLSVSFDRIGLSLQPARTYVFSLAAGITATDGQTLGYTWLGEVQYQHQSAFTSFGEGHGVWEKSSGPQLPFYARNLTAAWEWLLPVDKENLAEAALKIDGYEYPPVYGEYGYLKRDFKGKIPPVQPKERALVPNPDQIQNFGLNLSPYLNSEGSGLIWAAVQGKEAIPKSYRVEQEASASLVQVTNLGLSVKDSPLNTLVFVTALDTGLPVEGASVEIRKLDNSVFWKGTTDKDGIAMAPDTKIRSDKGGYWQPQFLVISQKGQDTGYLVSDWNEGIRSWDFSIPFGSGEDKPLLRGTVFADRGVYKLGEEVHLKAILRSDAPNGMALFPKGAKAKITIKDSRDDERDKRTLPLLEWGSCDWVFTIPAEAPLGGYSVTAEIDGQHGVAYGRFLVAAYRKPDFRVDVNLGSTGDVAGAALSGVVSGRYLFGAPMGGRPVRWTFSRTELHEVPEIVKEKFPEEQYAFLKESWNGEEEGRAEETLQQKEETLGADGTLHLELATDKSAGVPCAYTLEGEVEDVSRQKIAGRASFAVAPAPWYLALKRPGFFCDTKTGIKSEVAAVGLDGQPVAGVAIKASLTEVQWISVRRAEGQGMYTWESQIKKDEVWSKTLDSSKGTVSLEGAIPEGGVFVLSVTASDSEGRTTTTDTEFYALGGGYTAWERYDSNRIDLVPEKKTYKPGETARILIKSPWEKATALLTVEREGIRSFKRFDLSSTHQTVEVPLTEREIPNVFVSVLLVKGRTSDQLEKDGSDPGKPAFKLGYTELKLENATKRLAVSVGSDKEEYRPADKAKFSADVKDRDGKPVVGEVTLWAVDYGVLSLTGYKTPDVLTSVWVAKGLQVMTEESRQKLISRRVITPKGAEEGGDGGYEAGPGTLVRKDFRVLALWVGSAVTDSKGHFETEALLPESLTTFRVMAVAQDKLHRFGWGEKEIRVSKPLLLTPAFPRFLSLGDKAYFGAVLHSLMKQGGTAVVTMTSLDPELLEVDGAPQSVEVAAKGSAEARFNVAAKGEGLARIRMSAKLLGEEDAFEAILPVELLAPPEVVAAYGVAKPEAKETLSLPAGVLSDTGGLRVELSSTAMVGLGEGARYVVDYPYGCAEQRASCALALMLAADLGGAFSLPGIAPDGLGDVTQKTLSELEAYQCDDGGFVYWRGEPCVWASPYLTSYVLNVMQRGVSLGYRVTPSVLQRGYAYLESSMGREKPANESYWPSYTAWQAFACKVLAEGGKNVDSHLTRLYGYKDKMPVFGLCFLWDALRASGRGAGDPMCSDVERQVKNAIAPEGGSSHVEELADPYLLYYWNSNIRSTAIALGSITRNSDEASLVTGLVRWLMSARKNGRWGNTQENAWAMASLVDYYRKYEKETPDFTATVALGLKTILSASFKGRDTKAVTNDTPMARLLPEGKAGEALPLTFKEEGSGSLFYVARLKYASAAASREAMDQGIHVEREYAPLKGGAATTSYKAGELIQVTLKFKLTKERRFVAVTDPIPAGFEPVESWFATTARDLAQTQDEDTEQSQQWLDAWQRGGFDHVERHDDRVLLFATRLSEGEHSFRYVVRATTAGSFKVESARAEEMYEPEVFGRTASCEVEIKP